MTTEFKVGDVVCAKSKFYDTRIVGMLVEEYRYLSGGIWGAIHVWQGEISRWSVIPECHADPDTPEAKALLAQYALNRLSE